MDDREVRATPSPPRAGASSTAPSLDEIRLHRDELFALASRFGITGVSVFGSVARGQSTSESDIDLVVEADTETSYFALADFSLEAEALLGRAVDVVFRSALLGGRDDAVVAGEVRL